MVDAPAPHTARAKSRALGNGAPAAAAIGSIEIDADARIVSDLGDFDFVLGGGLVPGSMVLLGGEPGIGKSTLLLQVAARLRAQDRPVLFVSGEESGTQIRLRADRLRESRVGDVTFLADTDIDQISDRAVDLRPALIVIDSIQTMRCADIDNAPGSVAQVRECAARLARLAKDGGPAIVLVGHVTKDGVVAGPRTLEHAVDVVLYFDAVNGSEHRILRATKNRFGPAHEVGVFRMVSTGLEAVANASALMLEGRSSAPGCAVAAVLGGTRPILVEVQALCTRSSYGAPQRVSTGFDRQRLALLLAVLEKRAGVRLSESDVFLNVVGGLRLSEPAADLAVAAALVSASCDRATPADTVYFGEVGLGGEVRAVPAADRRIAEAVRLGFDCVVGPATASRAEIGVPGTHEVRHVPVATVRALADLIMGRES